MEDIEFEQEITFNQVRDSLLLNLQKEYVAVVCAFRPSTFDSNFRLMVDIEDKLTGDIWRGDYQQKYIEEIAAKAGSAKTFPVFFKML